MSADGKISGKDGPSGRNVCAPDQASRQQSMTGERDVIGDLLKIVEVRSEYRELPQKPDDIEARIEQLGYKRYDNPFAIFRDQIRSAFPIKIKPFEIASTSPLRIITAAMEWELDLDQMGFIMGFIDKVSGEMKAQGIDKSTKVILGKPLKDYLFADHSKPTQEPPPFDISIDISDEVEELDGLDVGDFFIFEPLLCSNAAKDYGHFSRRDPVVWQKLTESAIVWKRGEKGWKQSGGYTFSPHYFSLSQKVRKVAWYYGKNAILSY